LALLGSGQNKVFLNGVGTLITVVKIFFMGEGVVDMGIATKARRKKSARQKSVRHKSAAT
jgi:hypothetical protein